MRRILPVFISAVALSLAFNAAQAADINDQVYNNGYYQNADRPYRNFDNYYGPRHYGHVRHHGHKAGYRSAPRYEDCPYYNDNYRNRPNRPYPDCPRAPSQPRGFN